MSFTVKVKEEISEIESSRSELIAELSGYIRNNSIITKDKLTTTTENEFIIDRISNTINNIYNIKPKIDVIKNMNFSKKNLYQLKKC